MKKKKKEDVLSKSVAWATLISAGGTVISTIMAAISLELMLSNGQTKNNGSNKVSLIVSLIVCIVFATAFCRYLYIIFKRFKKVIKEIEGGQTEKACPLQHAKFEYVTVKISDLLGEFLSKNAARVEKVRIICYGRNGFHKIVPRIIT